MLSGDGLKQAPEQYKSLGNVLLTCESIEELRTLAPLPKDAQEMIDRAVVQVGLERLTIAADVMGSGLTFPLSDPLSVMELYWEEESKAGHAQRTMLPDARGERQIADRSGNRIPIYVTLDDFSFNIRTLRAASRAGAPLDTSHVGQATRRVNESIEDAMINGAGIAVAGNSVPGLMNEGNVNTQAYVDTEAWTHANHSGEDILTDVLNMIDACQSAYHYGPYNLYIPTAYGMEIEKDFKSATSGTTRERLESIQVGGRGLRVAVADRLATDRTILVQMTNDVVDMVVGQEPTVVSWEDGPGWNRYFAVMAFIVPRVKSDYDGNSGICVGNTS
jgi:hypothetical protein